MHLYSAPFCHLIPSRQKFKTLNLEPKRDLNGKNRKDFERVMKLNS